VRLAALGQRNMDQGDEPIADPAELAQVRRQARGVYLKGIVLGAVLTALTLLPP
jgi:hypothetical protein